MSDPIRYHVSMPAPNSHLYEIEAFFPAHTENLQVSLPVWTPGSYLIREYARHVQGFEAFNVSGERLLVQRVDKRTFQVNAIAQPIRCRYRVYANELTVRTSHLDNTHAYFNGATLFYYVESLRNQQHRVRVDAPPGWQTFVALDNVAGEFVANNYDELVDSPFEVGPHTPLEFTASGVRHQVILWGEPQLDNTKLKDDLTRIIEAEASIFGGLPMQRYLFLLYATDKGRGGLEHCASTTLAYPRTGFSTPRGWEDFLTLCAHEYFHLWNVKRIVPAQLTPFDYGKENHTELLWFFEGGTSYYDSLVVCRSGLMGANRYLTRLGETITSLHATPGRLVLSLVDASFLAWIKHYRPDENSGNSAISYYLKGEVVCMLLDLAIRRATSGGASLDDVLRSLWSRAQHKIGVSEDEIERLIREIAGDSIAPYLQKGLRTTEELDYSYFDDVGLSLKFRARESSGDKGGTPPRNRSDRAQSYLGVVPKSGASISWIASDSPAMRAGLYADDEVIALDGIKCDAGGLVARCDEKRPGDIVQVTIFRRDRLLEIAVTLGERSADVAYLSKVENPTPAQKQAFKSWLGAEWDAA